MRRLLLVLALGSCAEDELRFAGPSSIKGKQIPGVPTTSFFPAPYDATDPPVSRSAKEAHAAASQVEPTPALSCLTCHRSGPGAAAAFAGYVASQGGGPAKRADVVVLDGAGKRFAVKTDDDGFFWLSAAALGEVGAGARTAVRDAEGREAEMGPSFTGGNCTSAACHGPSESAGVVTVPR